MMVNLHFHWPEQGICRLSRFGLYNLESSPDTTCGWQSRAAGQANIVLESILGATLNSGLWLASQSLHQVAVLRGGTFRVVSLNPCWAAGGQADGTVPDSTSSWHPASADAAVHELGWAPAALGEPGKEPKLLWPRSSRAELRVVNKLTQQHGTAMHKARQLVCPIPDLLAELQPVGAWFRCCCCPQWSLPAGTQLCGVATAVCKELARCGTPSRPA